MPFRGSLLAFPIILWSLLTTSCASDPAEKLYMAALRGEEEGMGRANQIRLLDRAVALAPRRAWYRETRAIYQIDSRTFELAAADLDTAILLSDRPYLRFLRGLVQCQRREYDRSLADFDAAIAGQPENTQFYRGRSLARAAVGQYPGALLDAERLVALAPRSAESYFARGVALTGLRQDSAAVLDFTESLRRRPELIYPLRARALAYERVGDRLRAAADRQRADQLEREHPTEAVCLDPFRY